MILGCSFPQNLTSTGLSFFLVFFFNFADSAKPDSHMQVRDKTPKADITWQFSDYNITIYAESCYIERLLLILLIWQRTIFVQTILVTIACSGIIGSIFRRIFLGHGFLDGT